jgi:hypothetical protein
MSSQSCNQKKSSRRTPMTRSCSGSSRCRCGWIGTNNWANSLMSWSHS